MNCSDSFKLRNHGWQFWGGTLATIDDAINFTVREDSTSKIFRDFCAISKNLTGGWKIIKNHTQEIFCSEDVSDDDDDYDNDDDDDDELFLWYGRPTKGA